MWACAKSIIQYLMKTLEGWLLSEGEQVLGLWIVYDCVLLLFIYYLEATLHKCDSLLSCYETYSAVSV